MKQTNAYLRAVRAAQRAIERAREALDRVTDPGDRNSLVREYGPGGHPLEKVDRELAQVVIRAEHVARTDACVKCAGLGWIQSTRDHGLLGVPLVQDDCPHCTDGRVERPGKIAKALRSRRLP